MVLKGWEAATLPFQTGDKIGPKSHSKNPELQCPNNTSPQNADVDVFPISTLSLSIFTSVQYIQNEHVANTCFVYGRYTTDFIRATK